jgi:hypothetical protein
MAIVSNSTTITRVQYQGTYYRTVVRNSATVFNLSDWTGTGNTGFSLTSSYNGGNYNHPNLVPGFSLGSSLTSSFPPQNYGAGTILRVTITANILNAFWSYIGDSSSEYSTSIYMQGSAGGNVGTMQTSLNNSYPPGLYQGQYAQFYDFTTDYYFLFQASGSGYTNDQFIRFDYYQINQTA